MAVLMVMVVPGNGIEGSKFGVPCSLAGNYGGGWLGLRAWRAACVTSRTVKVNPIITLKPAPRSLFSALSPP